ncbi:MAG: glycosyltransferase family 2 protein [Gammaproteobacteria bacterium]|nr:glycosyltransferase family 2 protein [Gammaproteobacteria bacterium]
MNNTDFGSSGSHPTADILVVVPVMNRPQYIGVALDAILKQTLQPDYLIVVDDCSTDNTAAEVQAWFDTKAPPFATKLIVHNENKGASAARNSGLACAEEKHRYIYFLDSDDVPSPTFLEKTRDALEKHPQAVAASADRILKNQNGEVQYLNQKRLSINPYHWFIDMGAGVSSSTLLRTRLIEKLGGYNEVLLTGHDTELFFRLASLGEWLHVSGSPVVMHEHSTHLRDMHDDPLRKWCHIFEDCVARFAVQKDLEAEVYRFLLARKWRHAGLELLAQQRCRQAQDCFRRSITWHVKSGFKSFFYWLLALPAVLLFRILDKLKLYDCFMDAVKRIHSQYKFRF